MTEIKSKIKKGSVNLYADMFVMFRCSQSRAISTACCNYIGKGNQFVVLVCMSCCGYVPSIDVYKPINGKIIEVFKLNVEP